MEPKFKVGEEVYFCTFPSGYYRGFVESIDIHIDNKNTEITYHIVNGIASMHCNEEYIAKTKEEVLRLNYNRKIDTLKKDIEDIQKNLDKHKEQLDKYVQELGELDH